MRILVVEDERKVAAFICTGLEDETYSVEVVPDGVSGEEAARRGVYDLIVLDLMLPGRDGVEVCRNLRAAGVRTPVLMLTARTALQEKVAGLDSGADDYLTKPFAFEEFLARVRALLRRGPRADVLPLRCADLVLDRARLRVRRHGRDIQLTHREFVLLEYLVRHPGQVISREELAEQVWGHEIDSGSNVIDVTVSHLRGKVDRGPGPQLIRTARGHGYVLRHDEDP
ncbi:MAG: response regulator transcription factor [Deltaproteobacteria bacterium]|nr:response regulator transcription factor [Deltaproteobacteria bacterium]